MKNIKKIIPAALFIILSASALLYLFYHNKSDYTSVFFAFDTIVSLKISDDFISETKAELMRLSDIFDNYNENSEISELNRKKELVCSEELSDIIRKTEDLSNIYGKRLDITAGELSMLWNTSLEAGYVPPAGEIKKCLEYTGYENISADGNRITLRDGISLDLGSCAKGYALDAVMPLFEKNAPEYALVSLGSSTLLYSSDDEYIFNVAVKSSHDTIAGTVKTEPCFVSTSGDYERFTEIDDIKYHHIIDLETGYPADSGLSSVTVFCSSGIVSDFLSTLIFLEGTENLDKHLRSDKYKIIAIDTKGKIFKSDTLEFSKSNQSF